MADLTEVYAALKKADEAGDTDAAKKLADYIRAQSETPAATTEGMPSPREKNYGMSEKTLAVPQEKPYLNMPPYDPAEVVKALGRGATQSVLTAGGLGDVTGGAIGATTPEYKMFAKDVGIKETPEYYAPFEMVGGLVGPPIISKGVNLLQRGANVARDLYTTYAGMPYNKLLEAVGPDAPVIINALRANKTGVESGGQAAAGVGNVPFSRFAKGYEDKSPQIYSDLTDRQKALIETQAKRVEDVASTEQKALADQVANPDVQALGDRITSLAEKEKAAVKKDVIRPAFKAAEDLAGNTPIDISNVTKKAAEIADTIDPDAAAILSRRLGKFQGTTTTPEKFVSLGEGAGYSVEGTPVIKPPTATLSEVGDVRSAINNAAVKAKAAGDEDSYRRLMQLHTEVDNAIMGSKSLPPEAIDAYKKALDVYKTEYAPRFKTGLQVNLFKIKNGENAIGASKVVDKFFANPDTTDNFLDMFKGNPAAMRDAQAGMEGLFRESVIKDGVINPKAYETFIKKYGPQIEKLDNAGLNIRSKLDDLVSKTSNISVPKEAATALKAEGTNLPAGPKATQITSEVGNIVKTLAPEDLDTIAQIAARGARYKELSTPSTRPEISGFKYNPLQLTKRVAAEIYDALATRLGNKTAERISELLSTPEGTQAFIEMAQKQAATSAARKAAANTAFQSRNALATQLGVTGAISNALAGQ